MQTDQDPLTAFGANYPAFGKDGVFGEVELRAAFGANHCLGFDSGDLGWFGLGLGLLLGVSSAFPCVGVSVVPCHDLSPLWSVFLGVEPFALRSLTFFLSSDVPDRDRGARNASPHTTTGRT